MLVMGVSRQSWTQPLQSQGPVACLVDLGAPASLHAAAPSTGWGMVFKHALVLCGC